MSSKRQRRPNVRLEEIGDIPAAFACVFSHKTTENLGRKRYKTEFLNCNEIENNTICGFVKKSPELVVSDPGISPRILADLQQNRENKNPNSTKLTFELVSPDEIDTTGSNLNFGTITKKSRVMKRRGRSTMGNNNLFCSVWSSRLSPEFSNDEKYSSGKEYGELASKAYNDFHPVDGFEDFSDHSTPATSQEAAAHDVDENYDVRQQGNSNDFWQEDALCERNDVNPVSADAWDEENFGDGNVNTVTRWLEEQGFGKYAGVFEMHEVDEEALPLLTLEDLKEMGIFAVGPRRKLFTAIQQLRGEDVTI